MTPSDPLLPQDWPALTPLVDRLLDAPAELRAALLIELSAGDPQRRSQLERLVAECERELPLLDRPAVERFDQLYRDEPAPPLPEVLGGRYRIERELGRGGMALVYLAQDLKHARQVAIKIVRPELAAALGRDRFLREIGIAARLRHPNIMPLYDSGDADGVLYFVMPYEEGLSLRARLEREGGLPIADGISILRDVARALEYAHEQGVVHRDVKPDNVLLSGNAAVVTDFGIAKAVSAALTEAGGSTITQAGSVIGTPAYMAPEQGMGDPATDHRADLYSFGCLAYEVFAGKPPFSGSTTFQIIAAQMGTSASPVTDSRAEVPTALAGLIARCLERDPAVRPQSAKELLNVLGSVPTLEPIPSPRRRISLRLGALLTAATLLVAAAGFAILRGRTADAGPVTVAVLPLGSQGGDSTQVLAAEGFSLDIAGSLVKFLSVRVMSRGSTVKYRGERDLDLKRIGKELGARYLVYGMLSNIGGHLTVLVQLMDSDNEALVWSDRFDASAGLAAVKDQIVDIIGDSLRSRAGGRLGAQVAATAAAHHGSNEAYRLYLIGKQILNRRAQSVAASIPLFRQAIALDTLSAEAWSGLSLALALTPRLQFLPAESFTAEATAAARRALRLNPKLSEPHVSLGMVREYAWQWDLAESEYKTALELDSHDVEARVQYGSNLRIRDRLAESLRQDQLAREDDPASALVASHLAYAWYLLGQKDSALAESARAQQIDATNLTTVLLGSLMLVSEGHREEAFRLIRNVPASSGMALYVLGKLGERDTVLARLRILESTRPPSPRVNTARASAMLGLGDTAQALEALERATDAKELWFWGMVPSGPNMAGIRGSARFRAILARAGLSQK